VRLNENVGVVIIELIAADCEVNAFASSYRRYRPVDRGKLMDQSSSSRT
jgi:hypothetical protein